MVYCRSQAAHIAKTTGCKGSYPLQKLKFHDPMKQTVPDAMHTIKDAIEHFVYLIVGKDDSTKVVAAEAELKRFGFSTGDSIPVNLGSASIPYRINKEQKKVADMCDASIICPEHVDFKPRPFFTKTQFNSHDWKQVNFIVY